MEIHRGKKVNSFTQNYTKIPLPFLTEAGDRFNPF